MSEEVRRVPLDRRVCVIRANRIDLRPERAALILPLLGLLAGIGLLVAVAVFASDLPAGVLMLMLVPGIFIAPFSAMGLIYSLIGASMVIEKEKQSVRFQQGLLGLGIGTEELVPFWKVDHIEVEDCKLGETSMKGLRPPVDFRAWDITLVKVSGKRLPVAQVVAPNEDDLIDEGFTRALDAAEAIAAMAGSRVEITAAVEPEEERDQLSQEARTPSSHRDE